MANNIEYAMWGLPKGSTERYDEVLLLSGASDYRRVEKVKELATRDGFHSFRIAAIDLDAPPDFARTVTI